MEKEVRYEGESYPYGVLKQPLHSPGEKKDGHLKFLCQKILGASTPMVSSAKQNNYDNLVVAFISCVLKSSLLRLNSFTQASSVSLIF